MKIPKLKKKAFTIPLGIYPFTIFVCFLDLNLLMEEIKKYSNPPSEEESNKLFSELKEGSDEYGAITWNLKSGNIIIFIPKDTNSNYMVNMITHETLHATQMIMETIGTKLTEETDEPFCYLNGYINEQIFKQI